MREVVLIATVRANQSWSRKSTFERFIISLWNSDLTDPCEIYNFMSLVGVLCNTMHYHMANLKCESVHIDSKIVLFIRAKKQKSDWVCLLIFFSELVQFSRIIKIIKKDGHVTR